MTVPPMKDERAWHLFCLGSDLTNLSDPSSDLNGDDHDDDDGDPDIEGESVTDAPAEPDDTLDEIFAKLKRRRVEVSNALTGPSNDLNQGLRAEVEGADAGGEGRPGSRGVRPTMELLLQFDQVLVQRLFAMHAAWLMQSSVAFYS